MDKLFNWFGGSMSNFIKITNDILDVGFISSMVVHPTTGATSIFVGTTRDHFGDKTVLRLEYEAYTPMAEKKLQELCQEIRSNVNI